VFVVSVLDGTHAFHCLFFSNKQFSTWNEKWKDQELSIKKRLVEKLKNEENKETKAFTGEVSKEKLDVQISDLSRSGNTVWRNVTPAVAKNQSEPPDPKQPCST
jgi:hypothetical protein